MPATWPGTLQQVINEQGFTMNIGETLLRSDMDAGIQKTRRRFTRPVNTYSCSILLHKDLYSTFYNFFNTSINGGATTFYFNHPISGVQSTFRFTAPPQIAPLGGQMFQVSMQWEEMP